MALKKELRRDSIRKRIRKVVAGTSERPRLSVYRSNKQIYAQLIDDLKGVTLVSASSAETEISAQKVNKIEQAKLVGQSLASKASSAGIKSVVFDRGGYLYHGRVKSLAESAREGGLQF
jgi:large subunit ribosomal protein L18